MKSTQAGSAEGNEVTNNTHCWPYMDDKSTNGGDLLLKGFEFDRETGRYRFPNNVVPLADRHWHAT